MTQCVARAIMYKYFAVRPDEFGRLRPGRSREENPPEQQQWTLVPSRTHQEVYEAADAITLQRIAEQIDESKHSKVELQLEKQLLDKDTLVAQLKEQIEELEGRAKRQVPLHQRELAAREAETKSVHQRLQRKEKEVEAREQEISRKNGELLALRSHCACLEQKTGMMQAQLRLLITKVQEHTIGGESKGRQRKI